MKFPRNAMRFTNVKSNSLIFWKFVPAMTLALIRFGAPTFFAIPNAPSRHSLVDAPGAKVNSDKTAASFKT